MNLKLQWKYTKKASVYDKKVIIERVKWMLGKWAMNA
jgi:hypothetical protein